MKYSKLPKDFKKKWLKALRSGKYKQGNAELRNTVNEYCCLGVAAHIVGATCITGESFIYKGRGIRGISKVPKELIETNGDFGGGSNELTLLLSNMNDRGDSFEKIADWIEENL